MKRGNVKVVCTMGPAIASAVKLTSLIRHGMDVVRLNFSHGTHQEHGRHIDLIRECSRAALEPVAILQDLQGIKIRVGQVKDGGMELKNGREIVIRPIDAGGRTPIDAGGGAATASNGGAATASTSGAVATSESRILCGDGVIYISYPHILDDLREGQKVLINDGLFTLVVREMRADGAVCVVKEGGTLTSNKGVNLPDSEISTRPFTQKDRADLAFGIEAGVDFVALSFVETREFIDEVREFIRARGADIPIIAKIERPRALKNIDDILEAADGIMVARGDLAVEISSEEVPLIQKRLIRKANEHGKLVITATQMLESMCEHSRPTRAETTDVANAIIDGTDAVMTSAETSVGKFPIETVQMMGKIIAVTEAAISLPEGFSGTFQKRLDNDARLAYAVAEASVTAAAKIGAKCIVAFTRSGYTALLLSKCRPTVPIIAFTTEEKMMPQMSLYWGVRPFFMRRLHDTDEMIREVESLLINMDIARDDDIVVIAASMPLSTAGKTNFLKVHRIGEGSG
jgi:pyruvate kinase